MDYRRYNDVCYIRMDRGDEIIATILDICKQEGIQSATFWGIGGCSDAEIQVFDPQARAFQTERYEGMLELVSLMGNVICDEDGALTHHAHALFAYQENGEHHVAAGHLKSSTVLYTGEIELRPVLGPAIHKQFDPETGTRFWSF